MSRSNESLGRTRLEALRMLDAAVWAFLQRKVAQVGKVETSELVDQKPGDKGTKYVEFLFKVIYFKERNAPKETCFVRLWLRNVGLNKDTPIVQKVLITDEHAMVLGEWDGSGTANAGIDSFELFLRVLSQASLSCLIELIPTQEALFYDRCPALQLATMLPGRVIKSIGDDIVMVQAIDTLTNNPAAELKMCITRNGMYWPEIITLFRYKGATPDVVASLRFFYTEKLWTTPDDTW